MCVFTHTGAHALTKWFSETQRVTHSRVMTLLLDRHLYSLCISKILEKNKNILCVLTKEPEAPSYPFKSSCLSN